MMSCYISKRSEVIVSVTSSITSFLPRAVGYCVDIFQLVSVHMHTVYYPKTKVLTAALSVSGQLYLLGILCILLFGLFDWLFAFLSLTEACIWTFPILPSVPYMGFLSTAQAPCTQLTCPLHMSLWWVKHLPARWGKTTPHRCIFIWGSPDSNY